MWRNRAEGRKGGRTEGNSLSPSGRRVCPENRVPSRESSTGSVVPSVRPSALPSGFTLIEILVVIAVIAILASVVTPMVFRNVGDAKVSAAQGPDRDPVHGARFLPSGQRLLPVNLAGARRPADPASGRPPALNWRGPYLRKAVPLDPWGRPYLYASPGSANPDSYDLSSQGRDGRPGGEGEDGDLTSWGEGLQQ